MQSTNHLELIWKLRQRLLRLIKLGQPKQLSSTIQTNEYSNNDLSTHVEECVRRLFNTSYTVETFIQNVQQILNVTIKTNLTLFFTQTIPLAHQYLQQHQFNPYSWETFKMITLQTSSNLISNTSDLTRLPSLQQAHFRLPPSCPQLIDLTSSISTQPSQEPTFLTPIIRSDADQYQQQLIIRFAHKNFYLDESGEQLFLQTLYTFLKYIIRRLHFFAQHRIDTYLLNSNTYEITSNVREQIRFLIELDKLQNGNFNNNINMNKFQQKKSEMMNIMGDDEKRMQGHEYRLSVIEELRKKEADETACLVLRESRLKRQKLSDNYQKSISTRIIRANLQDLIVVMENEQTLKRSRTLLYAYANR
ncbi:unnamed protein product [Adineta steineri]|uniref:Uncharacterized protein n=1 Tax=Adineta steineri TaxID=433720 RepID=A0A813RZX9_9BILA|nr:unnamed protein product [Adineta steineri]